MTPSFRTALMNALLAEADKHSNLEGAHSKASARVEIGGSDLLREGKDVAILATGVMVKPAPGGLGGVVSEVPGASYPAPIEKVGVKVVGRKAHACIAKN